MSNIYSDKWFDVFLQAQSGDTTKQEVDFLARHLPQPHYHTILDLCCGNGRHARLLATTGYQVTAVDCSHKLIQEAAARSCKAISFETLDMRQLSELQGQFDAVINLWQSFGFFDEEENQEVLRQIRSKLLPRGRLILDVYHRGFFERHQGERQLVILGTRVHEEKYVTNKRLQVILTYLDTGETDRFDWRVYDPDELGDELQALGFRCKTRCTDFDEALLATPERPRMQLVFEAVDG
ncbi:MAG: hypothetical protein CVV27_19985 [Candidatus Melainabacteria bacterium HGW-Melainabacteria-1]|nr:MAG: hypothetical protein CVV27_19985 [Candidatus Melainabacteria bacterium HGW-Melainabacteria-1]